MGKEPSTQSVAQTRPLSVFGNMANAGSHARSTHTARFDGTTMATGAP
jgi:hypothetical protein